MLTLNQPEDDGPDEQHPEMVGSVMMGAGPVAHGSARGLLSFPPGSHVTLLPLPGGGSRVASRDTRPSDRPDVRTPREHDAEVFAGSCGARGGGDT